MTGGSEREQRLRQALAGTVESAGLYLEGVRIKGPAREPIVEITVDLESGPGGVDSDRLEDVSRAVSQWFDDNDPFEGRYSLEVGTPGSRPLTQPRHYSRAQGRLLKIRAQGSDIIGRVVSAADDSVTVDTREGRVCLAYETIEKATVEFEFSPVKEG